jgi:dolichyl-phosphooligosaccharide-protein glycotransferase
MWVIPIVISAFLLRVVPQLSYVFTDSGVMFRGVDPYHHLRLIENMIANFPQALAIDYYAVPGGMNIGFPPLLNWIVAGISKLGFNYEYVAAFLPPILGALIALPVYLIGKTLFNRSVGIIAAVLVVFLPTELLNRSLLGFIDHHVLEAFLMAWTIYFAVKFTQCLKYKYSILAGVSFGLYMMTWLGGMFFAGILVIAFALQFLYKPSKTLLNGYLVVFVIGLLMELTYFGQPYLSGNIILMPVMIVGLASLKLFLWNKKKGLIILGVLGVVGGTIALTFYGAEMALALRSVFWGFESAIAEAQPSYPYVIVATLGVCALFMFPGAWYAAKKGNVILIVIWVILLLAMIGQRRWGYYFVIPVSLVSALFISQMGDWVQANMRKAIMTVAVVFLLFPSARTIIAVTTQPNYMNQDYYEALVWLRDNTDEPFPTPESDWMDAGIINFMAGNKYGDDAYYSLQNLGNPSYTVLAWWDYGHWITQVAHRVPVSNPAAQISIEMRQYLMSQNQEVAESFIQDLAIQPKYIFATYEMSTPYKYYAVVYQLGMGQAEVDKTIENSMATRLWENRGITYELIFENDNVKIYER